MDILSNTLRKYLRNMTSTRTDLKTIFEPSRETKVCREADVVVVGGGPGGVSAAIAAARAGADTVLIERYGHLGGMATGGLVNIIPNLSDIYGRQHIAGFCQEIIDRMQTRDAIHTTRKEEWGMGGKTLVGRYSGAGLNHFYVRKNSIIGKDVVLYTVLVDPEVLKDELNRMVEEAGVKLYLHSWGTQAIMNGNSVEGVIFESKSGRQAVLGKVMIDSTGDGDIFTSAGAEYLTMIKTGRRNSHLAFCFWITNVNNKEEYRFRRTEPEKYAVLMDELAKKGGFTMHFRGLLKGQESVVWFHPHIACSNQTDVEEMTRVDVTSRRRALITWEFLKKNVPGYQKSFIMLTAPQLSTTGGKRIIGEYVLTGKDMDSDEPFKDTIAVFASNDRGEASLKHPRMFIPYRSLVPQRIENLLVACRGFSSDDEVNDYFNLIPHCLCFGQAAGTAAAMAVNDGVSPRKVNIQALRSNLVKQGAILPAAAGVQE
jgi:hypothetical protein